jgi:MYXO-CTERM domain-containing protein
VSGTTTSTSGGSARAVEPVSLLFGGAGLAGAVLLRRALRK